MSIDFPLSVTAILTVIGSATFAALVGQWLKAYLPDWRYTNLLVLVLAEVAAIIAQCIAMDWQPTGAGIYSAVLIGLVGATLATFGYETILNLLAVAGVGPRTAPKP